MKEYNDRWNRPLINPPVTEADLSKDYCSDCGAEFTGVHGCEWPYMDL